MAKTITMQLNSESFTINSYSRVTTIDDGGIRSTASVGFVDNSGYDRLVDLDEITSLAIKVDGTSIYSLTGISARITTINERLTEDTSGTSVVSITATITFDVSEGE